MSGNQVLVIEDDDDMRDILTELLASAGYEVTAAESALGTVALVQRLRPRVILLDLGLPYRSGALLLADLKAEATTAQIPIIIISALPETLSAERRALASSIVKKPFDVETVLNAVRAACASAPGCATSSAGAGLGPGG